MGSEEEEQHHINTVLPSETTLALLQHFDLKYRQKQTFKYRSIGGLLQVQLCF